VLAVTAAESAHHMHDMGGVEIGAMPMGGGVTVGDLEITGAFTRATLPNAPVGGGYLTITNNGAADDRLVSVSTPLAGTSQIHEMKMEGDVMKMNELPDGLAIPAGESVSLAPGGYHLMFMGLTGPFVEGQSIAVTLTFEKAGTVEVQLPVGSPAAKGPAMGHSMHSEIVTVQFGAVA
jgi:copper(I)-binding protein